MEDDHNGRRQPQWKTTSMEDNINGRQLNGRQPQWKTISMELFFQWRITSMEEDLKDALQEDDISLLS